MARQRFSAEQIIHKLREADVALAGGTAVNYRAVKWIKTVPRIAFSDAAIHSFGSFSSVSTSDEHLEEVIAVLEKHEGTVLPTVTGKVAPSKAAHDELESSKPSPGRIASNAPTLVASGHLRGLGDHGLGLAQVAPPVAARSQPRRAPHEALHATSENTRGNRGCS